jgi:alkylation response protein AidB-like acyl-CoA dehydrogenase
MAAARRRGRRGHPKIQKVCDEMKAALEAAREDLLLEDHSVIALDPRDEHPRPIAITSM